ncbi:MAG: hypothetical protein KJ734_15505, partial [Chloroflexi bacterium]|nr:hypothetical protein [Chloroflexota bacterium]
MPAPDLTSADTHVNLVQRIQVLEQERDQLQTELRHANRAVDACVADLMRARQQLGDTSLALQLSQEQESRLMREQAILQERTRLARELHDTLAHTLSGVTVQLEAVRVSLDSDPATAQTLLDQSLTTTRTGLTETRRALQALRASPLEDLGLALAL